jgi:hypothetical protein
MKRCLLLCIVSVITIFSVLLPLLPGTASADVNSDAAAFCKTAEPFNGKYPNGKIQNPPSNDAYTSCVDGYTLEKTNPAVGETSYCNSLGRSNPSACTAGWTAAKNNSQPGSPGSNAASTDTIVCNGFGGDKLTYCHSVLANQCSSYTSANTTSTLNTQAKNCFKGAWAKHNGQSNPCGSNAACKKGFTSVAAPAPAAPGSATKQLGCTAQITDPLTWIICPVVDILTKIINLVDKMITDQLDVKTNAIFCDTGPNFNTCQDYYKAWQSFRNIALGLMAIAGLMIIIAQALGLEILDAYTIRKTLPRLLVAAIAITVSWPLMRFLIQLSDDLGFGVRQLIYAPFSNLSDSVDLSFGGGIGNLFGAAVGVGGAAVAVPAWLLTGGLGAMLGFVGTATLAVLVAIIVLILRQVAIILLMLLAPLAIVAYILPNTQRIFRLWWESFSKALLMFPLIAAFIATGRVFSAIAIHNGGFINSVIGFAAYFAPYFMIPLTFKMAGSTVGAMGNLVNNRASGGFQALSKFRGNRRRAGLDRLQKGEAFRNAPAGSRRQRLGRAYQVASLMNPDETGMNPRKMIRNARALAERADVDKALKFNESKAFQPIVADDDAHRAILHGDMTEASASEYLNGLGHLTAGERAQKLAHIEMARKELGQKGLGAAAIIAQSGTSTGYAGGASEMLADISRVAGGNENLRNTIIGGVKRTSEGAGRLDLSPSFSDTVIQSRNIANASSTADAVGAGGVIRTDEHGARMTQRQAAIADAGVQLSENILDTRSAGAIMSQKGLAIEHLLPAVVSRIEGARANLETVRNGGTVMVRDTSSNDPTAMVALTPEGAERRMMQVLASTQSLHDVASQVSPEAGRLIADNVLSRPLTMVLPDGTPSEPVTVMGAIDQAKAGPTRDYFEQMHMQYGRESEADMEARRRGTETADPTRVLGAP